MLITLPTPLSPNSLLRVHAGTPAGRFSLKVVCVALTTSIPELGTGVGLRVVVPLDYVLTTGTWFQRLTAARICNEKDVMYYLTC